MQRDEFYPNFYIAYLTTIWYDNGVERRGLNMSKKTKEEKLEIEKKRLVFEIVIGSLMVAFLIFVGVYYGCALNQLR